MPTLSENDLLQAVGGDLNIIENVISQSQINEFETTISNIYAIGSVTYSNTIEENNIDILKLTDEFTMICRCEEINRIEIETVIPSGAESLEDIKRMTRCGMGPCQWKMCKTSVMQLLKNYIPNKNVQLPRLRFPLTPISIKTLSSLPTEGKADVVDILSNAIKVNTNSVVRREDHD